MNDKMKDELARRAAYLKRKAEQLPSLVELQRRMAAGENARDVLMEDERPWVKS